jgi:hypothetical protein
MERFYNSQKVLLSKTTHALVWAQQWKSVTLDGGTSPGKKFKVFVQS